MLTMITEKINIAGTEYQVSATTYRMLQQAKENLIQSVQNAREHTTQQAPQVAEPQVDLSQIAEDFPQEPVSPVQPPIKQTKKKKTK